MLKRNNLKRKKTFHFPVSLSPTLESATVGLKGCSFPSEPFALLPWVTALTAQGAVTNSAPPKKKKQQVPNEQKELHPISWLAQHKLKH